MSESKPYETNYFNLFIILLTFLSQNSSFANSESDILFTEKMTTCVSKDSIILRFTSDHWDKDTEIEGSGVSLDADPDDNRQKSVKLTDNTANDNLTFNITFISGEIKTKIRIMTTFVNNCENSYTSSCTVIIAFLASLCLILFTALALALIILRRKKPITFNFGQKENRDYDRNQFNENSYEESYEQTNKESIDVTNSNVMNAKNSSKDSPRPSLPRKSSLKPPKSTFNEQINNSSSHENPGYNGGDLEVVDELSEDKVIEETNHIQESRRKSIVTFGDTTQVNYR